MTRTSLWCSVVQATQNRACDQLNPKPKYQWHEPSSLSWDGDFFYESIDDELGSLFLDLFMRQMSDLGDNLK